MAAAKQGSLPCVKLLLYHKADLFYRHVTLTKNYNICTFVKKNSMLEQYLKNCQGMQNQTVSRYKYIDELSHVIDAWNGLQI